MCLVLTALLQEPIRRPCFVARTTGSPTPNWFYWALESVNVQGLMQSNTIFSLMFIKRLWKKCIGQPQCREHGQCDATCKCSWVSTAIVKGCQLASTRWTRFDPWRGGEASLVPTFLSDSRLHPGLAQVACTNMQHFVLWWYCSITYNYHKE